MKHLSENKRPQSGFAPLLKIGFKTNLSRAGFTLIELLLVSLLIPLVAFAVYANFSSGVRIWQRLHQETSLEDLNIFSQKASKDFDAAVKYSKTALEGDEASVKFPALIDTEEKLGGSRAIGQIRYYYDLGEKAIKREQRNVSQVYRESETKGETLLREASSFRIGYYAMDKQDKIFQWVEAWEDRPNEFPVAVRFEFERPGDSGMRRIQKVFMIPAGGLVDENHP